MGLDFPWLHGKTYRGEMYPLMVELRGMSVSGERLTEGGHPLALTLLSITLIKRSMGSSLRLTPSCVRPLDGSVVLGGSSTPGVQAGGRPWRGAALQGPRRCSVELAQSFASPSPRVADGTLFFQTLLSFFLFVCLFLSAQPY